VENTQRSPRIALVRPWQAARMAPERDRAWCCRGIAAHLERSRHLLQRVWPRSELLRRCKQLLTWTLLGSRLAPVCALNDGPRRTRRPRPNGTPSPRRLGPVVQLPVDPRDLGVESIIDGNGVDLDSVAR